MAQHDMVIDNQSHTALRADLNNALAAVVSLNSGASAPTTTYAHQMWMDTANLLVKQRNAANSAWVTIGYLGEPGWDMVSNDAFFVRMSADQTINDATATKLNFNTETYDINGDYDTGTYRHTPTRGGRYIYGVIAICNSLGDGKEFETYLYRNGSLHARGTKNAAGAVVNMISVATSLADMNGSTDYMEAYCEHNQGTTRDIASGAGNSIFWGIRINRV